MPEFMRVPFGLPSTAIRPMANAGGVTRLLRWGHGEPLSESLVVLYLGLGNEPTAGCGSQKPRRVLLWLVRLLDLFQQRL